VFAGRRGKITPWPGLSSVDLGQSWAEEISGGPKEAEGAKVLVALIAKARRCGRVSLDLFHIMNKPKIIAYLKPTCGWSQGVRAVLRKYDLPFEDRNIIGDPDQRREMVEKSGQTLSPCVEIDGYLLADVSGEEVEAYLISRKLVDSNDRAPEIPINAGCP
jgi:glutaredoxin